MSDVDRYTLSRTMPKNFAPALQNFKTDAPRQISSGTTHE